MLNRLSRFHLVRPKHICLPRLQTREDVSHEGLCSSVWRSLQLSPTFLLLSLLLSALLSHHDDLANIRSSFGPNSTTLLASYLDFAVLLKELLIEELTLLLVVHRPKMDEDAAWSSIAGIFAASVNTACR